MREKGLAPIVIVLLIAAAILGYIIYSSKNTISLRQVSQEPNLRIAYIQAENKEMKTRETGDVWMMNLDGSNKRKVTNSPNIVLLIDWSEDNEYLLAIKGEQTEEHSFKNSLVSINAKTGEVLYLADTKAYSFHDRINVWWLSSKEILHIQEGNLTKIRVDDGKTEVLVNNKMNDFLTKKIDDYELENIDISPDRSKVLVEYVEDIRSSNLSTKLLIYDIKGVLIKELTLPQNHYFASWRENKIIYYTRVPDDAIWEMDLDGLNKVKLLDYKRDELAVDDSDKEGYGYITAVTTTLDGKNLLYTVTLTDWLSSNYYLYDIINSKNYQVYTMNQHVEKLKQVNKDAGELAVSKDGKIATFWVREAEKYNGMYVRDVIKDIMIKVCETGCYSPKFSN